ncbi:MAG TPA: hypothetical protein DCE41_17925 [Cytophagales bacterium]|nr:hypothetical protein [Cytophagales bacterium]HAA23648.1 hypothetical protein [Cytophagales bacterium]HAP65371.1 hypothetical protein [Cytophagales bacterium]
MPKRLIIVTTHFGTNFSGGSTATCEIWGRLQHHFDEVRVLGTQLGEHPFQNLTFVPYKNWRQAYRHLRQWAKEEGSLFYGDFYNAFLLRAARVPFSFTYHDNWPDLGRLGGKQRWWNLYYWPIYRYLFVRAHPLFVVSEHKAARLRALGLQPILAANGFTRGKAITGELTPHILMVGNVDARKYQLALALFQHWAPPDGVEVHVYGHASDSALLGQLEALPFVRYCGYTQEVPYAQYKLLLHTSAMENLPIVLCEAIYQRVSVVAFDVGGHRELIDGANGYLVSPYDTQAMADQLNRTLKGDLPPHNLTAINHRNWQKASALYAHNLGITEELETAHE